MVQKRLHSGAKWLFRIRGFFTFLFLLIFFGIWMGVVFGAVLINFFGIGIVGGLIFAFVIFFVLFMVLIEVYARLSYKFWRYEFTKDQLKIERGIIWKRYSNIPYQRIQNVDITRGIIARLLRFSTVSVQTAGYSMPTNSRGFGYMSEGYIPAVSMKEAEEIREFVISRIIKRKGQGL